MVLPWHSSPTSSPNSRTLQCGAMDQELGVDVTEVQVPVSRRLQEVGTVIPLAFGGFAEYSEGVHTPVELRKFRLRKEGMSAGITEKIGRGGRTNSQKVVLGNSDWSSPVQPSPSLPVANPCGGLRKTSATLPSRRRVGTMVMGCTG